MTAILLLAASLAAPPTTTFSVRVTDPAGGAVAGAEALPQGFATRSVALSWFDEPKEAATDADGRAEFTLVDGFEGRPVVRVDYVVRHPDWCTLERRLWGDAAKGPLEDAVTLEAGRRETIELTALDGDVSPDDCKVVCPGAGVRGEVLFEAVEGRLVTRPLPVSATALRVVAERDGVRQFSDWAGRAAADVTDPPPIPVLLQRGMPLTVRLSENVPRPVVEGRYRVAFSTPGVEAAQRDWGKAAGKIAADGTFTLMDVPPFCDVQVAASCEGFVSEQATDAEVAELSGPRKALLLNGWMRHAKPVDAEEGEATLPMSKAASLSLRVVRKDETPVAGAAVSLNPNASFVGRFTSGFPVPSSMKTDAEGAVTFPTLPPGTVRGVQLYRVVGEQYKKLRVLEGLPVKLAAGERSEATLTVE